MALRSNIWGREGILLDRCDRDSIFYYKRNIFREMHAEYLKIFVGGFGPLINEQDLLNHFGKFGPITSANVVKNLKKGYNKGYGFAVCGDQDTVQRILKHDQIIGTQLSLT